MRPLTALAVVVAIAGITAAVNSNTHVHGAAAVAIYLAGLVVACLAGILIHGDHGQPARRRSDETLRGGRS